VAAETSAPTGVPAALVLRAEPQDRDSRRPMLPPAVDAEVAVVGPEEQRPQAWVFQVEPVPSVETAGAGSSPLFGGREEKKPGIRDAASLERPSPRA
jgi:hypothetical protein